MGKSALRIAVGALLYPCVAAVWFPASAQDSAPAKQSPPQKPLELLKTAAQINGLETDAIGPWHLKATFTLFDALGNPKDHGWYEALWVSPHERKDIVESTGFSQAWILRRKKSVRVSGSRSQWPDLLRKMVGGFTHPIYETEDHSLQFAFEKPNTENPPMRCVSSAYSHSENALNKAMSKSTLCLDVAEPVVLDRIDAFGIETVRENIFRFQGSYVARDLTVTRSGRVYLKAHLESLEELNPIDQSGLVPPPKALEILPVYLVFKSSADARFLQIRNVEPEYPADALAARVSGVVNVKTTVDADGRVSDVLALDGPPLLQEAALNAVRQYRFKPDPSHDTRIETVFPVEFKLPVTK